MSVQSSRGVPVPFWLKVLFFCFLMVTEASASSRVRDTRATESVLEFPMVLIIPNLGPCYLPTLPQNLL
jgi:hypothetical protein